MTPRSTINPRPTSSIRQLSSSSSFTPLHIATQSPKLNTPFLIPRPVSSSRADSSRRKQSEHMDTPPAQPTTPTPKKGRKPRRGGGARQRGQAQEVGSPDVDQDHAPSTEDEEELLNLLGVTSPPPASSTQAVERQGSGVDIPGLLRVSKRDVEAASSKPNGRGGRRKKELNGDIDPVKLNSTDAAGSPSPALRNGRARKGKAQADDNVQSEGEGKKGGKRRTRQGGEPSNSNSSASLPQPVSGLSASRPKSSKLPPQSKYEGTAEDSDAFETASLSQSLPTGGIFAPDPQSSNQGRKKGKGKENGAQRADESAVWDMPEQAGSGQGLTWQQQLQSSTNSTDSPRRSNKSTLQSGSTNNSDRKLRAPRANPSNPLHLAYPPSAMNSSPLVPRPAHARRRSLDAVVQPSAFDSTIPYHTGFNVNRAPQTPVKLPSAMNPSAGLPLLSGDFPRVNSFGKLGGGPAPGVGHGAPVPTSQSSAQGFKYAGPTFHNSPHAASLPKPDLEDF